MTDLAVGKFYKGDDYEFPDESLLARSAAQLRFLIQQHLPGALYLVDGLEGMTSVKVDYAQDRIGQARDLLLDLGETFTRDEIQVLSFLRWPLSREEQAEQDLQRARETEQFEPLYQTRKVVQRKALAAAAEAFHGRLAENSPEAHGISLVIGRSGHSFADGVITTTGPSGVDVQALVEQLHALDVRSARIRSYSCSIAGVTFETDPIPSWSVAMDLPSPASVWDLLMQWYREHGIYPAPYIEIQWQYQGEHKCDECSLHEIWPNLFNTTDWAALIDALPSPAIPHADAVASAPNFLNDPPGSQPPRRRGFVRFIRDWAGALFRRK